MLDFLGALQCSSVLPGNVWLCLFRRRNTFGFICFFLLLFWYLIYSNIHPFCHCFYLARGVAHHPILFYSQNITLNLSTWACWYVQDGLYMYRKHTVTWNCTSMLWVCVWQCDGPHVVTQIATEDIKVIDMINYAFLFFTSGSVAKFYHYAIDGLLFQCFELPCTCLDFLAVKTLCFTCLSIKLLSLVIHKP